MADTPRRPAHGVADPELALALHPVPGAVPRRLRRGSLLWLALMQHRRKVQIWLTWTAVTFPALLLAAGSEAALPIACALLAAGIGWLGALLTAWEVTLTWHTLRWGQSAWARVRSLRSSPSPDPDPAQRLHRVTFDFTDARGQLRHGEVSEYGVELAQLRAGDELPIIYAPWSNESTAPGQRGARTAPQGKPRSTRWVAVPGLWGARFEMPPPPPALPAHAAASAHADTPAWPARVEPFEAPLWDAAMEGQAPLRGMTRAVARMLGFPRPRRQIGALRLDEEGLTISLNDGATSHLGWRDPFVAQLSAFPVSHDRQTLTVRLRPRGHGTGAERTLALTALLPTEHVPAGLVRQQAHAPVLDPDALEVLWPLLRAAASLHGERVAALGALGAGENQAQAIENKVFSSH